MLYESRYYSLEESYLPIVSFLTQSTALFAVDVAIICKGIYIQ
jgi:hypothetical protein